jgi:hypothetical protein
MTLDLGKIPKVKPLALKLPKMVKAPSFKMPATKALKVAKTKILKSAVSKAKKFTPVYRYMK